MKYFLLTFLLVSHLITNAQTSSISGIIKNSINNQPVEFAKVKIVGLPKGAFTDSLGYYKIDGIEPGVYSITAASAGFNEFILADITVTVSRTTELNFAC